MFDKLNGLPFRNFQSFGLYLFDFKEIFCEVEIFQLIQILFPFFTGIGNFVDDLGHLTKDGCL